MAITKTNELPAEGKVTIDINNGHLEALSKIANDYNIDTIENALGFIIAVVSKSGGKPIKVGEDSFLPGESIKKKTQAAASVNNPDSNLS